MIDKVQKIREEVERLRNLHQIKYQNLDTNDNMCLVECGKRNLCNDLLSFIDSLQEEPFFKVGDTIQKKDNNSIKYSIINKTSDGYHTLRGLSDTIVIWFSEQDQWELVEEPVSEELEEAISQSFIYHENRGDDFRSDKQIETAYRYGFETGAKWQKAKDESTTEDLGEYINELSKQFPEVSFAKLSRIAVRVAQWQKEQMMSKAIDALVHTFDNGYIRVGTQLLENNKYGLKVDDKVKVIIIKDE